MDAFRSVDADTSDAQLIIFKCLRAGEACAFVGKPVISEKGVSCVCDFQCRVADLSDDHLVCFLCSVCFTHFFLRKGKLKYVSG